MKPFSQACENNKDPILEKLRIHFADRSRVLEMGSGTGQHAVHFAQHLPHLIWQTSDLIENHAGINAWLNEAQLPNLLPPIELDANQTAWQMPECDAVFTANTLHIMSWDEVKKFFQHLPGVLIPKNGRVAIYGPFNYNGEFTSDSNRQFNEWLKQQAAHRAIRDFESVNELAAEVNLSLDCDYAMPANNRLLVFSSSS